jgi:hypothetical protein
MVRPDYGDCNGAHDFYRRQLSGLAAQKVLPSGINTGFASPTLIKGTPSEELQIFTMVNEWHGALPGIGRLQRHRVWQDRRSADGYNARSPGCAAGRYGNRLYCEIGDCLIETADLNAGRQSCHAHSAGNARRERKRQHVGKL